MTLMCVTCGTENRDAAKFCKGCGGKLVALPERPAKEREAVDEAWGATVQSSLEEDLRPDGVGAATVIVPAGASRPSPLPTAPSAVESRPRRIRDTRSHAAVWALLGAVLLVAAVGSWYAYRAGASKTATDVGPAATAAPVAVPTAVEPATPPTAPPAPAPRSEAPAIAVPPTSPAASTLAQTTATTPSAPPRKVRKTVPPPTPLTVAAVMPPPAPEPPPPAVAAPLPSPPPVPQSACGGRNFIATAQCMAAQCARAEFATHAQCEAVRRQQRIDEEKRNPLYAN